MSVGAKDAVEQARHRRDVALYDLENEEATRVKMAEIEEVQCHDHFASMGDTTGVSPKCKAMMILH